MTIELHDRLRAQVREDAGRDPEPAIIDSQTIRSTPTIPVATSGYDGGNYLGASVMAGRADQNWWMAVTQGLWPVITTGSPGR